MESSDPLEGLGTSERAACLIAMQALGGTAKAWDTNGRQGAVDAMLTLPNGRTAAFEVTMVGDETEHEVSAMVRLAAARWQTPGAWAWGVDLGSPDDFPRLASSHRHIIEVCEAHGVTDPQHLPWAVQEAEPDVLWLVEESASQLYGFPDVPALRDDGTRRSIWATPGGTGGAAWESLDDLPAALVNLFTTDNLVKHVAKVGRPEAAEGVPAERHLFLILSLSALPFSLFDAFATGVALPDATPPLPGRVTHLWLAPAFGERVALLDANGWRDIDLSREDA
jgi:hypothetical protein